MVRGRRDRADGPSKPRARKYSSWLRRPSLQGSGAKCTDRDAPGRVRECPAQSADPQRGGSRPRKCPAGVHVSPPGYAVVRLRCCQRCCQTGRRLRCCQPGRRLVSLRPRAAPATVVSDCDDDEVAAALADAVEGALGARARTARCGPGPGGRRRYRGRPSIASRRRQPPLGRVAARSGEDRAPRRRILTGRAQLPNVGSNAGSRRWPTEGAEG